MSGFYEETRRKIWRRILLLILFCAGCYTPFNNLNGRISDKQYSKTYNRTVEDIKAHYFAVEAQEIIKDVPCVDGVTFGGSYVVGVNLWGTLAGIFTGSGWSPKCVISDIGLKRHGVEPIIHEYIHHVEHLVDGKKFHEAYIRMATDRLWAGLFLYAEIRADKWVTNTFGISKYSEYIAYVGGRMAAQGSGPDYMWEVFKRILKK